MVAEDLRFPPLSADDDDDEINYRREDDDNDEEEEEEEEETLSFCDLPIYSDSFKWDDTFSTSLGTDHHDADADDFFEFFSEESTDSLTTSRAHARDNIIFCGKLIPYRGAPVKPNEAVSFRRDREFRVSVVASPPHMMKPRWYFYMFGMARAPRPEMEMRTRQSRRHQRSGSGSGSRSSGAFASSGGTENGDTTKRKASSSKTSRAGGLKGLWWLWRAVGCRSRHVENVAKAAYGAVPRVS